MIEVFGPESSGKTTMALHVIAEAQAAGGCAAFIDAEHALDPGYARKLGVDIDSLLISQPDCGEQALEITNALVSTGNIDVIVVDSVAALVPKAELEGEMGDSFMGLHARLMSQALHAQAHRGALSRAETRCLIFINQVREKIGVMFGNPETTTGGRALKFYSSVRVEVRRMGSLKDGDQVIGNRTRVKVVKNKVAAPFFAKLKSISCTARGSPGKATFWIWEPSKGSSKKAEHGLASTASAWGRDAKIPGTFLREHHAVARSHRLWDPPENRVAEAGIRGLALNPDTARPRLNRTPSKHKRPARPVASRAAAQTA